MRWSCNKWGPEKMQWTRIAGKDSYKALTPDTREKHSREGSYLCFLSSREGWWLCAGSWVAAVLGKSRLSAYRKPTFVFWMFFLYRSNPKVCGGQVVRIGESTVSFRAHVLALYSYAVLCSTFQRYIYQQTCYFSPLSLTCMA